MDDGRYKRVTLNFMSGCSKISLCRIFGLCFFFFSLCESILLLLRLYQAVQKYILIAGLRNNVENCD